MTARRRQYTVAQVLLLIMLGALLCSFLAAAFRHVRTLEFFYPAILSPDLRVLGASYRADIRWPTGNVEGEETAFLVDLDARERLMPVRGPVDFSPDTTRLAMYDWDREGVRIWDLKPQRELPPPEGALKEVFTFSECGDELIILGENRMKRWDVNNRRWLGSVPIEQVEYADVEIFSPGGTLLARCWLNEETENSSVEIWDAASGELIRTITNPDEDNITRAMFTSDDTTIVVATYNHVTRIWDLETGDQRVMLEAVAETLTLSPTGDRLAFARQKGDAPGGFIVSVCDLDGGRLRKFGGLPTHFIGTMQFSRDGEVLAAADRRGVVTFWSMETGEVIRQIRGLKPPLPRGHWYMLAGVAAVWGTLWWLAKGSARASHERPGPRQKRDLGWHLVMAVALVGLTLGCTLIWLDPYETLGPYRWQPLLLVALMPLGCVVGLLISLVWFRYNLLNFLFGLLILVAMFLYAALVAVL
jgi:hypothetical protein